MKKVTYQTPKVKSLEIKVEYGFADSDPHQPTTDPLPTSNTEHEGFNGDNDDYYF